MGLFKEVKKPVIKAGGGGAGRQLAAAPLYREGAAVRRRLSERQ